MTPANCVSVAALLYKPVDRVTRSTLVLHVSCRRSHDPSHTANSSQPFFLLTFQDLLKHTPPGHPDHLLLQDALRISQNFLSSINQEGAPRRQVSPTAQVRGQGSEVDGGGDSVAVGCGCVPEPAAAEGCSDGGAGGGKQEAATRLPVQRRPALYQA